MADVDLPAAADMLSRAAAEFAEHLRLYYRLRPEEVEPTSSPGYWQRLEPCAGRGGCRSELHSTVGNEGPVRHTVSYFDPDREGGRFASPYRTWRLLREEET